MLERLYNILHGTGLIWVGICCGDTVSLRDTASLEKLVAMTRAPPMAHPEIAVRWDQTILR